MKCVIEKQQVIFSVLATDLHLMSPDGMFTPVNILEPVSTDIISDEKEWWGGMILHFSQVS